MSGNLHEGVSSGTSEQSGNPVDRLRADIKSGQFLQQFQMLPPKERAIVMNDLYNIVEKMQYIEPVHGDTHGWGIFDLCPEAFLSNFRKGRQLRVRDFQHRWQYRSLGTMLHSLTSLYQDQIDQYGDDAIAHLILSKPAFIKLQNEGIHTISDLEQRVQAKWSPPSTRRVIGEVRRKLNEWRSLPQESHRTA